ncbi:hypothetical protein ACFFGH_34235 [Lysobacter korlensis]|uniref:Uncharacterized protein n=1 Tax=Lysobacter korlensis TaxID=553636 RepID=A0ABV6S0Z4_9GAMM
MDSSAAVEGREFDWFARDAAGRIALFATGGSGPIPELVFQAIESHDAAADLVPVSGWGSPAVWQSYSSAGLYAYDWVDGADAYRRVATPAGTVSPAVAAAVADVPLPTFHSEFTRALEVRLGDLQHGT